MFPPQLTYDEATGGDYYGTLGTRSTEWRAGTSSSDCDTSLELTTGSLIYRISELAMRPQYGSGEEIKQSRT